MENALGYVDPYWTKDPMLLEILPELIENLDHEHSQVRRRAAEILSRLGRIARAALPQLLDTLNDSEKMVRRAAARAVENISRAAHLSSCVLLNRFDNR